MAVTLKQIADACGVSRGTVDRALHNRGRVQPEVAERIREMAEKLGYEPNAGGRALALMKKEIVIGVILQFAETVFIQSVEEGIHAAAAQMQSYGCRVQVLKFDGAQPDRVAEAMRELAQEGVSGIAMIATEHDVIRNEILACDERGIRVVTFNSDLPESGRICFVGEEMRKGGRAAAGLAADILEPGDKIAVFSGRQESRVQNERELGFRETLSQLARKLQITSISHTDDDPQRLLRQLRAALDAEQLPDAVYINTQGVREACALLKERGLGRKVRVIVH
ncbi:MAG: LacI family DNA-binding transcriptional regulator, partial [Eubacterium sp.]|nr:LacI family DNA-binding transcriptional regulator [Eubacterium sp.]